MTWRRAFLILLAVVVALSAVGAYVIVDQAVTIAYMSDGYRDTEEDLRLLAAAARGRVSRQDIVSAARTLAVDDGSAGTFNRLRVTFDAQGFVREAHLD